MLITQLPLWLVGRPWYFCALQHMKIDETKDPNIVDKVKDYTDTLDGNLSDTKYISTESNFEGFIMDEYHPHQRD